MKKLLLIATVLLLPASCGMTNTLVLPTAKQAPVILYQTRADYTHNVPITLDESGKQLLAYPAPSDLLFDGEPRLPVKLKKGYLLDQKGVSPNTAFTSYTYEEYGKLDSAPPPEELLSSVIDAEPFTQMYHCGKRSEYSDLVKELNRLIENELRDCKSLLVK